MIIRNALVYTEEGRFVEKDIYIENGIFVDELMEGGRDEVLDAQGCYAIPGLTDIHFHGCAGYDFCDGTQEAIRAIAEYEASVGVTSIVPATMTLDENVLVGICETAAEYVRNVKIDRAADLCGIHLEGPFVSESKKGAQNAEFIRKPDIDLYCRLDEASGHMVKLIAVAPEVDGAMEFIEWNGNSDNRFGRNGICNKSKSRQAVVSVAHTAADYETAKEAFEKGASHVTHLYNAMNPYTHRSPGVLAAAVEADAEVELICDGVHVHPAAVRTTFKLFGDDKIIFISDSMMATGLEDGDYQLGGQNVIVEGNKATLKDGTIAGSVTNLLDCMRAAVLEMGISLESAVKCAAVNPAKSVGIYDKYGSITAGKVANVVLLGKERLDLRAVVLRGNVITQSE